MLTSRRIIPAFRLRLPIKAAQLYHDDAAFGHRVPAKYELPDCKLQYRFPIWTDLIIDTKEELDNRNKNAPLLRYVESVRRHGHRAAQIDPLDLMDRE
jgi:probable 2-oxoglutarate dehydrogenase E1 component DHKTD1